MTTSQISEVIQHLRRAGLLQDAGQLSDGQLLESFLSRQDAAALEALVRRHAPMVWGVCRRVLGNHHDAEDAFQATVLVLIRKAASIRSRAKVGNWLYGVAHQTALKARATRAKRRRRERLVTPMPEPAVTDQDLWNDLQPLLDQEVSRLPEKYRTVIVLCELEGRTVREAARQLGCPEGTVASRVARARTMLAKRLAAKGVSLSGGALASALSEEAVSACVPPFVLTSTIKAVTLVAARQAAAGLVSAQVAALSEGVLKAMLLTKRKLATIVMLAAGLVVAGTGTGALLYQTKAAEQAHALEAQAAEQPQNEKTKNTNERERLRRELQEAQNRVATLEARLAALEGGHQQPLYEGKPASFWVKQLNDRSVSYREQAVAAVGKLAQEDKTLIPVLIDCLKDQTGTVSPLATAQLMMIGPQAKAAVPALINALQYKDWSGISSALRSIDPEAKQSIPILRKLVKDDKCQGRRRGAILLLGELDINALKVAAQADNTVITILGKSLEYRDSRNMAAKALAQLGPQAKAAVPELIKALKVDYQIGLLEEDRVAAALKKIDPEAAKKAGIKSR